MKKYIVTIDLGTTNIKVGLYDAELKELGMSSSTVQYITSGNRVEFDPEEYWLVCLRCVQNAIDTAGIDPKGIVTISLTGQAESLIVLDKNLSPLRNGISWMDSRSFEECEILKRNFPVQKGYNITGQADIIPTWPVTKMLWMKRNEKTIYHKAHRFLLLKDFIIFRFTGRFVAEYTVYNFSYYLDVRQKQYWTEILDFVGVNTGQLPELIEPGETVGIVKKDVASQLSLSDSVTVNSGALDHFAGMIGTGNIKEGIISETTGTVLAIATMVHQLKINKYNIPCQYNAIKNTYVLMPVCESGGVSLEWFKNNFLSDKDFNYLNREIAKTMHHRNEVIFLPYLTGTNSPEFDVKARGVFYGLTLQHTKIDMARAVMEGVTFLLKKNIALLENMNIKIDTLISLGGGAKSEAWNQMKADATGKNIHIPEYEEATSLGAAILGALANSFSSSIQEAVEKCVKMKRIYTPKNQGLYTEGYRKFIDIYERLIPVFHTT
jgi:sugar (pentulose or hexulose) kinase